MLIGQRSQCRRQDTCQGCLYGAYAQAPAQLASLAQIGGDAVIERDDFSSSFDSEMAGLRQDGNPPRPVEKRRVEGFFQGANMKAYGGLSQMPCLCGSNERAVPGYGK